MRPYIERIQTRATAPQDLIAVNTALVSGELTVANAERLIDELEDSWQGIDGPFAELAHHERRAVQVPSSTIVSIVRPLLGNRQESFVPASMSAKAEGWLGLLSVVEADPHLRTEAAMRYGRKAVIAAELHLTPRGGLLAYVALAVPLNAKSSIQIPTVFEATPLQDTVPV